MASLSRQLAQWVVGLRYEDLPPDVVDRAKGVTLHSLASVLLGSQSRDGQQAVQLITAEEAGVRHGASIMVHGTQVTKGGAAFANAEMAMAGGKLDSFRMLTHPGTSIGPAGFYHAYAGNNKGQLTYSFVGDTQTSLDKITANLGKEWLFLETLYRIYSTAGYNIAHVDVTAQLCAEHNIRYEDVARVEAVVTWLETQYPSPAFPSRREDAAPRPGSTPYYTAYGVVKRGFPGLRGQRAEPAGTNEPPAELGPSQR